MKQHLLLAFSTTLTTAALAFGCSSDELTSRTDVAGGAGGLSPNGGGLAEGGAATGGAVVGGGGANGGETAAPVVDGLTTQIEAECAHGPSHGSCAAKVSGNESGTRLENEGNAVGGLDTGDFVAYRNIDFGGANVLRVLYATTASGDIQLRLDGVDGPLLASWQPEPTGSNASFQFGAIRFEPVSGTHDLFVVGTSGRGIVTLDWLQLESCTPDCDDKECGDDGCGLACGECTGTDSCSDAGRCEPCVPDCEGKECGDDSCEGSCGAPCATGEVCSAERRCVPYETLGGPPRLRVEGADFVDPESNPVILRGVSLIDLGMQHEWRGGVPAMIDTLTGPGWSSRILRFPIYTAAQPRPFSLSDRQARELYMSEILRPAVDYATAKGQYVIIDFHEISNVTDRKDAEARAFWSYMARQFAAYPNVIYELYNEPIDNMGGCVDGTTDACWPPFKARAEGWIEIIREFAPDTLLLVGGPSWSQVIGPAADDPVSDANVGYVGHIYPFHMYSDAVANQIRRCAEVHPVILTEWGFGFDGEDDREPYATTVKALAEELGLSWTAWVADHSWGPPMFTSTGDLTDFGAFARDWLAEHD